jgi:hypothetical protein
MQSTKISNKGLKAIVAPGMGLSKVARITGTPVKHSNKIAPFIKTVRGLSHSPTVAASYESSGYGPVGGDARIKVIGVGGGGGNAVNRMISSGLQVSLPIVSALG